jgi:hypothetical protein
VLNTALNSSGWKDFTDEHWSDLKVALQELADAVRADEATKLDSDLQAF